MKDEKKSAFTPKVGTISLKARVEDQSLVVEIQDTSLGISENEQQRIFHQYNRQNSDVEHFCGLGLGLTL